MKKVIVIGAGVGGLTTAAILAKAGMDVTVLEAHVYPGGCAGTFFYQNYRFEAGATLAGGFAPGGPMDVVAKATGIQGWPMHPAEPAMVAHLPDGSQVTRWGDERRFGEYQAAFGVEAMNFWSWQEKTADAMWDLALRLPAWPPQSIMQMRDLMCKSWNWLKEDVHNRLKPSLAADAFRPMAFHLKGAPEKLRLFIDGQLLISAQTTSTHANALYAASALDLPRRGVVHLEGGMGAIAHTLAQAVNAHGGQVIYRKQAIHICIENGEVKGVETKRGEYFEADILVANLTPWNIANLLGDDAPAKLRRLPPQPRYGWGAFVVYIGLDSAVMPKDFPLHHQVIVGEPLGEGRSVFLSLSPEWDHSRAPDGRRALTISTHTQLTPWWDLYKNDRFRYEACKQTYTQRIVEAAERILPGIRDGIDILLPGTPVTFENYTHRTAGWVGGFPQTDLFRNWSPRLASNLWMVGDSIFPGQSTAAVALGGLRVAEEVKQAFLDDKVQHGEIRISTIRN